MTPIEVESYAAGAWIAPGSAAVPIRSAVTGEHIANCASDRVDFQNMLSCAKDRGGPVLRGMNFHQRGVMLKALAEYLHKYRDPLYQLSLYSGATQRDAMIDIDGGISTLFVYSSKGRRQMPDDTIYVDGEPESLSKAGNFLGQHLYSSRHGVGIHINAFNFPVWGMLEKLAPALLAGLPAIIKPATATSYITHACFKMIIESGLVPDGAVQLIAGGTGDLLDHLSGQDVVSFTGSAATATKLRTHPVINAEAVQFVAEQDSLNASVLGPDATPDTEEFSLFVTEVTREMTVKAGQKCTAIRRILVPEERKSSLIESLCKSLAKIRIGDPALESTRMGALVNQAQRDDVLSKVRTIETEATRVYGDTDDLQLDGATAENGAFLPPMLFDCDNPDKAQKIHSVEAFGPVATVMSYSSLEHAISLANKGGGSLVASVFTNDADVARRIVIGSASHHGRLYFANRVSGKEATGHGSPMPQLTHGGPGRAGGGEELGGIRAVLHNMQRTAVQANPDLLTAITRSYAPGSIQQSQGPHPFRLNFNQLQPGDTFNSQLRKITLDDIEHFAQFTGDTFYAHMDEEAAKANPFFPGRVAHGYLLISFAAGLFVDPDPGPVLANYGLENLRFTKPVSPNDSIRVQLTAKEKTSRNEQYGEVRWDVLLHNQLDELVAQYQLLTMNANE